MNLKNLGRVPLIVIGNTIYALGVVMFVMPCGLITGGSTGLALAAQHYLGVPVPGFVLVFNAVMFLLGAWVLGREFAVTTLISTFYYPVILGVFQQVPALGQMTDDKMLATVCGGCMIGAAIGIVIRAGASTGGMDIPPLLLQRQLGVPVSVSLYAFDLAILLVQMSFSDKEEILYGILLVLIYTVVLDKVMLLGQGKKQVSIITEKYEEMNHLLQERLDRGTTLIYAQTGYLHHDQKMIMTVVSGRELVHLSRIVQEADPDAFMIIGHVNEVKGRGFSRQKEYRSEDESDR